MYEIYQPDRDSHTASRDDTSGSFISNINRLADGDRVSPEWFQLDDQVDRLGLSQEERHYLEAGDLPAPHAHELRHLSRIVALFGLDNLEPTYLDSSFGRFQRYEIHAGKPAGPFRVAVPLIAQQMNQPRWVGTSLIDIWSDELGVVQRLRIQTKEAQKTWYELHFSEGLPTELLPGPSGPAMLPETDICPKDNAEAQAKGWAGFEDWEPSFLSPIRVGADAQGRVYDVVDVPSELTTEQVGQLPITNNELHVLDSYAFTYGLSQYDEVAVFHLDEQATAASNHMLDVQVLTFNHNEFGESVAGIRFDTQDAEVDRWSPFSKVACEIVLSPVVTSEQYIIVGEQSDTSRPDFDNNWELVDIDENGTIDSVSAPFAEFCANATLGFDPDGAAVSFLLWYATAPWRMGIPDGVPPPEVTRAEQGYQDCLERTTPTFPGGWCEFYPDY